MVHLISLITEMCKTISSGQWVSSWLRPTLLHRQDLWGDRLTSLKECVLVFLFLREWRRDTPLVGELKRLLVVRVHRDGWREVGSFTFVVDGLLAWVWKVLWWTKYLQERALYGLLNIPIMEPPGQIPNLTSLLIKRLPLLKMHLILRLLRYLSPNILNILVDRLNK